MNKMEVFGSWLFKPFAQFDVVKMEEAAQFLHIIPTTLFNTFIWNDFNFSMFYTNVNNSGHNQAMLI